MMARHLAEPGHLSASANPNSVYRYFDHAERLIYIGITARGIQRQQEHDKLSDWFQYATSQQIEKCPTRTSALALERELIKAYRPPFNKVHNGDWEPVRAAYLAVVAAENWLTSAQTGRPPAEGACAPCHAMYEDGEVCQFGSVAMVRNEFGFTWCGRTDCLVCHIQWHGFDEAIPVGYEEGQKAMASSVDYAHSKGWDEATEIYAADNMAALMLRAVVDGNLRRLGPSYVHSPGDVPCPPTEADLVAAPLEECPF